MGKLMGKKWSEIRAILLLSFYLGTVRFMSTERERLIT